MLDFTGPVHFTGPITIQHDNKAQLDRIEQKIETLETNVSEILDAVLGGLSPDELKVATERLRGTRDKLRGAATAPPQS